LARWKEVKAIVAIGSRDLRVGIVTPDSLKQIPDVPDRQRARPMFIGVGQGGARRSRGQPQMTKFPFAGGQSSTNLAQRLGVPQLTEEHGDELAPAGETSSMTLCVVLARGGFKFHTRD